MCVEFVKEVHDAVGLQGRGDDHDMLLVLSPMTAVSPAHLLPLHPRVRQLLELQQHQRRLFQRGRKSSYRTSLHLLPCRGQHRQLFLSFKSHIDAVRKKTSDPSASADILTDAGSTGLWGGERGPRLGPRA